MTNLDIANIFIANMDINIHVEMTGKGQVNQGIRDSLINQAYKAIRVGLDEEYIPLEDVESFEDYIVQNLREQIRSELPPEQDEGTVFVLTFQKKPLRG